MSTHEQGKASPRPWRVDSTTNLAYRAVDANGKVISFNRARLNEIVQAVNSFDAMRDALELAVEYWYSDHPNDTVIAEAAFTKIKAALALANEVSP